LNLSVVGLGKLGSPMVACFAAKGHRVIGVDLNERFVKLINEGKPPVFEPGLAEMLAKTEGRLTATTDLAHAVEHSDVTFLMVATPSEAGGAFSLKYALAAARSVGQALQKKDAFHLVVLTSTVMPGATTGELVPALEAASGKKCGADFGVCYSPEFISLGSVLRDFLNPDFILIGETDRRSGDLLAEFYRTVNDNRPPVARMAPVNAEIAKIALNTFVTTKISFANLLAQVCERLEGGDVDAVTAALGLDTRIGPKYLKGSLGYGGPCFPRDNVALTALARGLGVPAPLPEATDLINAQQVPRLKQLVKAYLPPGGVAGVAGLAYKPSTNVIEKAQGVELAQALLDDGVPVVAYDPCAAEPARAALKGNVRFAATASECARAADVLAVCLPCAEFKAVTPQDLARARGQATLLDCWRLFDREQFSRVCQYVALGTSDVLATGGAAAEEDYLLGPTWKRSQAA
jgi:UDPglucose 6-dehydrogenase